MKTIYSLLLILCASTALYAQQSKARRGVKSPPSPTAAPAPQQSSDFFVGEARVDVTKDETVVRLAMAQHGSVLIELPANDGPRYIIPGDPEMATVDQKALERNKRAIVVRPGAQFVPPLRNRKARTPAATVTAQMRSGLVVTFLFYPVEDLAQNVHRCVLAYNRDEVVARRRAAGLPVNLDMESRGEMAGQPAAPISISVDDSQGEKKETAPAKPNNNSTPATEAKPELATNASALPAPVSANAPPPNLKKSEVNKDLSDVIASSREALQQAVKRPKQFKHWTKPTHGLALSLLQPPASKDYSVVVIAVKNSTSLPLKLTPDGPDLFREMIDDKEKPLNIESNKKLHSEASDSTELIAPGAVFYYAIAYATPVLGAHQRIRVSVGQTNAADEPASIILASSEQ